MKTQLFFILILFHFLSCSKKSGSDANGQDQELIAPLGPTPVTVEMALGVTVTGLTSGTLTLETENGGELEITGNGTFFFPNSFTLDQPFQIEEKGISTTAYCDLSSASGTFSTELVVSISCEDISYPASLLYLRDDFVFLTGYNGLDVELPQGSRSAGSTFSVAPSLPAGMSLNAATGAIEGQPDAASVEATYTITQTRRDGSSIDTTLDLSVVDGFLVTSTEDAGDTAAGDGDCIATGVAAPNNCTLRAAIEESNALAGEQTIFFQGTHTLTSKLTITQDLVIIGHDDVTSIIDGDGQYRIFESSASIKLTLKNFTLQNADAEGNEGGAIRMTGSNHSFYFSRMKFIGNTCGSSEDGCAFHSDDALDFVIEYSEFRENHAVTYDASGWIRAGTGLIHNTLFRDNISDGFTSGLTITNGSNVTVRDSQFINNTSTNERGGLFFQDSSGSVLNCSFEDNEALRGAGLFVQNSAVNVENSSFKDNTATDNGGALMYSVGATGTVKNSSFVGNRANQYAGGIFVIGNTTDVTVYNSFFQDNRDVIDDEVDHCNTDIGAGATATYIFNYYDAADVEDCDRDGASSDNIIAADLGLGSFDFHGGVVKSWLLQSSSVLIDAGQNLNCTATDVFGTTRPIDGNGDMTATCDIGPYEFQ